MNIKKGDVFVKKEERLEVIKIAGNIVILSPMDEVNGVGVLRFLTEAQLNEFDYVHDEDPKKCGCGFAWGHSGKHARGVVIGVDMGKESILDRTVYAVPKVARWCEHGTDLNYFCEDCDGAKITEGIDKENDEKVGNLMRQILHTVAELNDVAGVERKIKVECQCEASCHHHCSSNCRRVGCHCECGEWHRG